MSSRQMRRLQDLVDRATGLDADEPESGEGEPTTMQPKRPDHHHHKKAKRDKREAAAAAPASASPAPSQPTKTSAPPTSATPSVSPVVKEPTLQLAARPPAAAAASSAADDWEEVSDDGDEGADDTSGKRAQAKKAPAEEGDAAAAAAAAAEEERRRKKAEKKKARQQQQRQRQAEEDALLDAVLARRENEQVAHGAGSAAGRVVAGSPVGDAGGGGVEGGSFSANAVPSSSPTTASPASAGPAGAAEASFLQLVMACDATQLDTRLERIRMFGIEAVEDVGDGRTPHRRADGRVRDTGSTSFFPPHHMSVKFVQSAFATPNRHRWIPYDSHGIYLTTEEVRGAWGQAWREYQLVCTSNAFRRAQASLEACQDRMGGVQELVDCLARNHVYHIPTLLQCVYAMEATGENAFATELLDVALFQVGVLLRRFALSGTWDGRQLPYHHGANTLIFQVLQRGVHAALRRGCLRTAFERTRCLLSLDPDDPCGMLLLLDYTALRAKRWVWLLEVRHRAVAVQAVHQQAHRSASANDAEAPGVQAALAAARLTLRDAALAEDTMQLPTYAFSWALAKHFMEREEARQEAQTPSSPAAPVRPSKVLRGITEAQRAALAATPPAVELLAIAVRRFPHAATRLVDALGGVEAVCGGDAPGRLLGAAGGQTSAWQQLVEQAEVAGEGDEAGVHATLADLFVTRHEELWKLNECVALLRQVVQRLAAEPADVGTATEEAAVVVATPSATRGPARYYGMSRDSVMGASVAPIPADLLEPDAAEMAMAQEAAALGLAGGPDEAPTVERLMEMLQNDLDAFGDNEYVRHLIDQLRRGFHDRFGGGADAADAAPAAEGAAEERDWYDVGESEDDMEAQEWFSVASGERSDADDAADEGHGGAAHN